MMHGLPLQRVADLQESFTRAPHICKLCSKTTRGGKPYCVDHIDNMPRVQTLQEDLTIRDEHIKMLAKWENIPRDSLVLEEAWDVIIRKGEISVGCLAKELRLGLQATHKLVVCMHRFGLIETAPMRRGTKVYPA